jgi:AcrR family transcriptional regulator
VAAKELFATRGYVGTTMRAVAAAADVDVALVSYYFGGKPGLFAAVIELPVNPAELIAEALAPGMDGAGERLVRTFLRSWEAPESGEALRSLFRASVAQTDAPLGVGEFASRALLQVYREALGGGPDAERRALLGANLMTGLALDRYLVGLEPLASQPVEVVVASVAPVLQFILTGDHGPPPRGDGPPAPREG